MEHPVPLSEKGETWNEKWKSRSAEGGSWSWPTYKGEKLNQLLVPILRQQNQRHCSFCDGYPLETTSTETIEHFRPKGAGLFPEHAFTWGNLFYCCNECQKNKLEQFDEDLLKPDADDYRFIDFFMFDFTTGEIFPNPRSSTSNLQRAEISITLYGLNEGFRPLHRLQELKRGRSKDFPIDDLPYRDFVEAATTS